MCLLVGSTQTIATINILVHALKKIGTRKVKLKYLIIDFIQKGAWKNIEIYDHIQHPIMTNTPLATPNKSIARKI